MPNALTRREWLRLSAGALLSLGLWPGRLRSAEAPATHDCTFIAENGTPAQLTLIKDSFSALGIPCHAVVGNHDYQSATDRSAYEQIFPEQSNYFFTHRGWQIIGLDSSEGTKWKDTR